jgi:hypothetical protein
MASLAACAWELLAIAGVRDALSMNAESSTTDKGRAAPH